MSIHHQKYLNFIKNERKTLEYLKNSSNIAKYFPDIVKQAEISYFNLSSVSKKLVNEELLFGCNFELLLERENKEVMIFLEVNIGRNFNPSNYVLSICENVKEQLELIRKFHFDYDKSNENNDKPVYHFQYGGKCTPLLSRKKINIESLKPWLSNPRISFYPINLALLFDLIFTEFVSEETKKIVNTPEWRKFIKENENEILKPYYTAINGFINENHSANFLIRDCLYGKNI